MMPTQAPTLEFSQQSVMRKPLKSVVLLLPVWGKSYINQFLEMGFPSLMAPGNIPAIAERLPVVLEFLTSAEDEAMLRSHPAFERLCAIATPAFRKIDHLIKARNYTTTLTLAYTEAVRARGSEMTDTCFLFLVSDYIIADGALSNVVSRIESGFSAVQVGNFQVVDTPARSWLRSKLSEDKGVLSLSARELVRLGLQHIHPITAAAILNNPLAHLSHSNKMFWRVDQNTLIGRFFLLHMTAIRPEITDFEIGAFCDYAFVPEMCPSGKVSVMTDSDDCMLIELQEIGHDSNFIRPGKAKPGQIAKSLNEWVTLHHRKNSDHTLVFHAEDVPDSIEKVMGESNQLLQEVNRHLSKTPHPHRGHPYWRGAMAAFRESCGQKLTDDDKYWLQGIHTRRSLALVKGRMALFGYPPRVFPWHQRWPDYKAILNFLDSVVNANDLKILSVSECPTPYTVLIADGKADSHRLETSMLFKLRPGQRAALKHKFDFCLLELDPSDIARSSKILDKLSPMLKQGGRILLTVNCTQPVTSILQTIIHGKAGTIRYRSDWIKEAGCVPSGWVRRQVLQRWDRLGNKALASPFAGLVEIALMTLPLALLTLVVNIHTAQKGNPELGCVNASSVYFLLEVS